MSLGYPSLLLDEIRQAAGATVALPSEGTRALLLDVAFYAGLKREEGRALSFALVFITPDVIDGLGSPIFSALVFEDPIDLTVEHVVKLAPALDHRMASIGVSEGPGGLQIWGFFRHGSSEFERNEGIANHSWGLGVDYLRITCESPGRLDIDVGSSRVASFVDGHLEPGARVFAEPGPVSEFLNAAGRAQGDRSYLETVQRVVWAIRAAQHGGTLLFLPDAGLRFLKPRYATDHRSRAIDDVRARTREAHEAMMKNSDIIQRLSKAEAAEDDDGPKQRGVAHLGIQMRAAVQQTYLTRNNLLEAVRFTAALANVDGALVLGPDLRVLAFGAMIEGTPQSAFDVHVARSATGETTRVIDVGMLGGTRHQSAARFCHARPNALAVVISQDGGVSCLVNDGTVLRAWKGVRLDRRQPVETRAGA
jgi:hypothetical protein